MLASAVLITLVAAFAFLLGRETEKGAGRKMLREWIDNHACYTCRENYEEQCLTPEEWDHL